jgi:hypothetical protein
MKIGGALGGVAGGALGFAGGRELSDIAIGEQSPNIGEELVEAGENVLEGVKLEMLGYIGGEFLTTHAKNLFKKIGIHPKRAAEKIRGVTERLKSAQRLGAEVTASEATGSTTMGKTENFLRKLLSPAGQFQRFDQKRFDALLKARFELINDVSRGINRKESMEALGISIKKEVDSLLAGKVQAKGRVLEKMRNEVLEIFGSPETYEQLGRTVKETIEGRQRELEGVASSFFNKARNVLPQRGRDIVKTGRTIGAINDAIKQEGKALSVVGQRNIAMLNDIKRDFAAGVDFDSLVRRRSDLNDIIGRLETAVGLPGEQQLVVSGKKVSRLFKGIKRALDDDLVAFAKQTGTDADGLIGLGVQTSKQKFEFVKNPAIKRMIRTEPEKILDVVLKPRQISLVKTLRGELGETGIKPLKDATSNRLLGIDIDEPFSSIAFNKRIKAAGEDTLRELYGEADFIALKDFAHRARTVERAAARFETTGAIPKALGLREMDLTGNKYYQSLIKTQRPQNLVDLVYQPGQTRNVKRTYAALRAMGKPEKIQDLKAAYIESILEVDPKTGRLIPQKVFVLWKFCV